MGYANAGMEVIYTGLHRHVAEVVQTAVHEDVDVIGLGIRAGAHMTIFPQLLEGLREAQADDVLVIGFEVDTPPGDVVEFVQSLQE